MTARSDSTPLIPGRALSSRYGGFGVRGVDAPLAGEHGPGLIGSAVSLPAENDDEFRAEILTIPGTLSYSRFFEDGTTEAEGPDGVHTGTWRLRKNNVIVGPDPQTYTFTFGPPPELSGAATPGDLTASGAIDAPNALTGAAAVGDLIGTGAIDAPNSLGGNATPDVVASSGAIDAPNALAGPATFADLSSSGTLNAPNNLGGTATPDVIVSTGTIASPATLAGSSALGDLAGGGEIVSAAPSTITGAAALADLAAAGTVDAPNLLGGTALLAELAATGLVDAPNLLGGAAALAEIDATGLLLSAPPSTLGGTASPLDLVAAGALFGGSSLLGDAALAELAASGLLDSGCTLLGQAAFDAITAGGEVAGITTPEVLDMYILLAPDDQIINVGGVASKDPEGKVWLGFQFKRYTTLPSDPDITITRERGAPDSNPTAVLSGTPIIIGTLVLQQVQGGVPFCDYLVRCEVSGTDGSRYVMAGVLPVRPAH